MKRKITFPMTIWMLALALMAAGCGGTSFRDSEAQSTKTNNVPTDWIGDDDTSEDTDGQNTGGLGIPPEEYYWTKSGDGRDDSSPYIVQTDDILKIKLRAGDGSVAISGNGSASQYPFAYACMQIAVSINGGPARLSPVLRNGNGWQYVYQGQYGPYWMDCCSGAPTSYVMNFSSEIQNQVGVNKSIKVTNAKIPRVSGCATQTLYKYESGSTHTAHVVSGTMEIQTNQTDGF